MASGQPRTLSPKWASWESLKKDHFHHASDVWSFAVLIWELLTECDVPYVGVASIPAMIEHLSQGHRLARPDGCTDKLWTIVSQCWIENHVERPKLQEVLGRLRRTLEDVAAASIAARLTATEAKMKAMKAARQAWLRPGFCWRAGDINLCSDLDKELETAYTLHGYVACADPRAVGDGSLAERFADAVERLVIDRGGRKGRQFKANVDKITICKNQMAIDRFNDKFYHLHFQRLRASRYLTNVGILGTLRTLPTRRLYSRNWNSSLWTQSSPSLVLARPRWY